MARHPNHRLVKTHRSYTVEEVATRFGVHWNPVRECVKRGLPTCDLKRPTLILGRDLAGFLVSSRTKNRQTCAPGELYRVHSYATGFFRLLHEWAEREAHEAGRHWGATGDH